MGYCSIQDVIDDVTEKVLIQITNDVDGAEEVNEEIVLTRIENASNYIDSYLTDHYSVPLTDEDEIKRIKPICISLTVCELYQRRIGLDYSESLVARRRMAIEDLIRYQKGLMKLSKGNPETKPGFYRVTKLTKLFPDEYLEDY